MAASAPRPKVSDGAVLFLTVALMGAPTVLGEHINHVLGSMMFWGGLMGLVLYVGWRWGGWLFGLIQVHEIAVATPEAATSNVSVSGGAYIGGDNSGTQAVFHGPVTINHAPTPPLKPGRTFLSPGITTVYLRGLVKDPSLTTYQTTKLIEPYVGKWMKVCGTVMDVSRINGTPAFTAMPFQSDEGGAPLLPNVGDCMLFFSNEWGERALLLARGEHLTVIGKIRTVSPNSMSFGDCEFSEDE